MALASILPRCERHGPLDTEQLCIKCSLRQTLGFFWDSRQLLSSFFFFLHSKPKEIHKSSPETVASGEIKLQWFKRKKKRKQKRPQIYENLFSFAAGSQFHPIQDRYWTFLFWAALSRDAVWRLRCSSSLCSHLLLISLSIRTAAQWGQASRPAPRCFLFSFNHPDGRQGDLQPVHWLLCDAMRRLGRVLRDTQSTMLKNDEGVKKSPFENRRSRGSASARPTVCKISRKLVYS